MPLASFGVKQPGRPQAAGTDPYIGAYIGNAHAPTIRECIVKVRDEWKRLICYYCLRKELGHDVFDWEGGRTIERIERAMFTDVLPLDSRIAVCYTERQG